MDPQPPPGWTKRWHTREDSGIRLDREGRWWHDDEQVEHPKIVEAFNRGLSPTGDGRFRLDFGTDWCFVHVEDAAYRVYALQPSEDGKLLLELSDRTTEALDPSTLALDDRGIFLCRVKSGRALARFTREAQAAFGELLEEDVAGNRLLLRVGGSRVPLSIDRGSLASD